MKASGQQRQYLVLENYIGGKFVHCENHIDSYDPSTGEVYCRVPDSGQEEVDAAVAAAKEAFPEWSACSPQQRAQVLNKLADLIEAHLEEFAQAESRDQGKTVAFARTVDIPRSAHNFRFFASSVLHHTTDCSQMDHMGCLNYTIRCPVGVGIPPGVVNIVFGTGPKAGDALVGHPNVPLISFTGSTATAQRITERSAPYCKKLSLELGGKNPAIIFADADLDQCIETTIRSSFSNQGEICLCTSRIYVERSIYSEFLERFVAATRKWKTGAPSDPSSNNGALISKEHLEKVRSFVALAKSEGGIIHCGEGVDQLDLPQQNNSGYFMPATVISGVSDSSRVMQEEIFGPVTCVSPFDTEEEAVSKGNGVRYGLACTVWSRDVGKIHRMARRLHTGLVWTNCWLVRDLNLPFGGMKHSGVGREGGKDSYHFFTEVKTVAIKH
ncbi:2-aminomuconic semialdehyde dehydrogenase isoform X2 [Echeneis naucrates]|uniref:2-aminomuconic semialdehyde dehydrogenase isoform X2 n=1 Tax=Echeneis naucrates TaxID=173247 RepID=UPI0011142264|nr:2-aminomuconic semialdehyde dehydrogenase isoform X2 [Echeneis naucrates]